MPLRRCLAALIVGGISSLMGMLSMSCSPHPPTPTPVTISPTIGVPTPPSGTPTPHPAPRKTALWLLVDRSTSMKECAGTERLYQLSGFFAHIAAVLSSNQDSPFLVSEIFFPNPDKGYISPALASEVWRKLREQEVRIEESGKNEYEQALDQVSRKCEREPRNIVLVLTDGTYSSDDKEKQRKEEQELKESLQRLTQQKGAEVYLILCRHRKPPEPWKALEVTAMLSGTYELDDWPEWVDDLGNALFGEWLKEENIRSGWITSTSTAVTLPGDTITFSVDLIPLNFNAEAWIDYMGNRHPLMATDAMILSLKEGFVHSHPDDGCEPLEGRLTLKDSIGLYLVKTYRTPPVKEDWVGTSVNYQSATLTISLKTSPDFDPSKFIRCYSGIELISEIAAASGQFQTSRSTLEWRPPAHTEPGDYPGTLYLKNHEGRILAEHSITLPVRLQPTPSHRSATAVSDSSQTDQKIYRMNFEYNYVPPEVRPQIFLCSAHTPTETEQINRNLSCGKASCCIGGDKCDVLCPTPIPCPSEVSSFCSNCVPVVFDNLCASQRIAVASQHPNPPQYTQTYTVTLYECLVKENGRKCDYTGLVFFWPEGPKAVATPHYFKRSGNTWILQP